MRKIITSSLFYLAMILFFTSCRAKINNQIKKLFIKTHEEEIRIAVFDYEYNYKDSFFKRSENGYIELSDAFSDKIQTIENIHKEFHLSNTISRDSEWDILMYYIKHPDNAPKLKWKYITKCPFCIAEAEGRLEVDECDWTQTDLFSSKINTLNDNLLDFMRNSEMKNLLFRDFEDYLKTNECFSEKKNANTFLTKRVVSSGNEYYANSTKKYETYMKNIRTIHEEAHKISYFGDIAKIFFYNYKDTISNGYPSKYQINYSYHEISCCPFCFLNYMNIQDGTLKNDDDRYNFSYGDFYFWQQQNKLSQDERSNFADQIFDKYVIDKEKTNPSNKKTDESMKLYSAKTISEEIRDNRLIAKDKYNGKRLKIRGQIESVDEEYVELLSGPYVFLPKEELKKLHRGQYITFIATVNFIDYSKNNTNSSGFEKWARDLDDALNDLDKISKDLSSGALGYSFEKPQLLQVEEGKLNDSSDWEDISIFDFF